MKTFKINFLDSNKNVLFDNIYTFFDLNDAIDYAEKIAANSNVNDLVTFEIFEL